ncbi:MAG TPA: hypothetical protein VEH27_11320 [Methylomirabilota bacterium]|nr:hypothetical protein [Methylomirabilota bacterium]
MATLPWRWSNPTPHGNHIYDLAIHNGVYVQVGDRGRIYTSEDLDTWKSVSSGTTQTLRSIASLGNRIVISGAEGTILWSDDLGAFNQVNLGTTAWLEGVAASSNVVVAVGDNGTIFSSTDGITWTQRASGTTASLTTVVHQNGFVAAGLGGVVVQSPDGITWTAGTGTAALGGKDVYKLESINNTLWAVGSSGLVASYSVRGWSAAAALGTNDLFAIAGSTNEWVAVGDNALYVKQGLAGNWTPQTSSTTSGYAPPWPYYSALWDGRLFAVGGKTGLLLEGFRTNTTSALQWYLTDSSPRNWLWSITRQGDLYAAVGNNGRILTSADGASWNQESSGVTSVLLGVGGRTNLIVAVGHGGTILTSPEAYEQVVTTNAQNQRVTNQVSVFGIRWTQQPAPTTKDLQGVGATEALVIVTGADGTILRSVNGTGWTASPSPASAFLSSVAFGNGTWVSTGDRGMILTSPDGVQWTTRASGTTNWIYQTRYLNGGFIAVGENGTVLTSQNGIQWAPQNLGFRRFANWINDVAFVNGKYYAVSSRGAALESVDSVTWVNLGSITSQSLYSAAINGSGQLVVAGTDGAILRAQVTPFNSPVRISDYSRSGSNSAFLFSGNLDQAFKLQTSADLLNWSDIMTAEITDSEGTLVHVQPDSGMGRQFFRTVTTASGP